MTQKFYTVADVDYGVHEAEMAAYLEAGTQRALALENRGPISYDTGGELAAHIVEAYNRYGFYIFEGVIKASELVDLERDVTAMWANAPAHRGALTDRLGRPALGVDNQAPVLSWVRPLSDPLGGTDKANGRHPAKMIEPAPPKDAPAHVLQLVLGSLQFSDACLRLYAHPDLLRVTEAVHGADFVPFNEAIWVKHPRLGGSVAWHQDGWTHWDNPDLDGNTHGFNFMAQLYGCTAANGVWVVPGSHLQGKIDIKQMVNQAGSDRLTDAVPLICQPGDVAICNRQAVHGSFANTSDDMRVTINFGFHRRSSVLGVEGGGVHNEVSIYDEARIEARAKVIGYAINARQAHFPLEEPYCYQPLQEQMHTLVYDAQARDALKDYNLLDLGI